MDEKSAHQDFARRLLEAAERSADDEEREPAVDKPRMPPRVAAAAPMAAAVRLRSSAMSTSLEDLRRQRLLFFGIHIITTGLITLLAVVASAVFVSFVLADKDWVSLSAAGSAAAAGILALIALQLLLPRSERTAGATRAQLEVAYLSTEKSIEFWEDHLRFQRQATGLVDAEQVARAVQSITESSERIMRMLATEPSPKAAAGQPSVEVARGAASPASRY